MTDSKCEELHWERMPAPDVAALAKKTNVALVPLGCMEAHGPHLPTGTDSYHALATCERAAAMEPAVILPPIFYNLNDQMQGYPGTIHISHDTLARFYYDLCVDLARNGFDRILFFIGHGGSEPPLDRMMSDLLAHYARTKEWPYFAVYTRLTTLTLEERKEIYREIHNHGHASAIETAWVLACRPDLVHLDRVDRPARQGGPTKLPDVFMRLPWERGVPDGYQLDPRAATVADGNTMLDAAARRLAEIIKRLKTFDPYKDC